MKRLIFSSLKINIMGIMFIFLLFGLPAISFAYEASTHEYLTGEAVNMYLNSQGGVQDELNADWFRKFLIDGSRHEDASFRFLRHYFDPTREKGLTLASSVSWNSAKAWPHKAESQLFGTDLGSSILSTRLSEEEQEAIDFNPDKLTLPRLFWEQYVRPSFSLEKISKKIAADYLREKGASSFLSTLGISRVAKLPFVLSPQGIITYAAKAIGINYGKTKWQTVFGTDGNIEAFGKKFSLGWELDERKKILNEVRLATTFTWEEAKRAYKSGEHEKAYFALGHVLHLLQDMASPEHVRNDLIVNVINESPYEEWATKYTPLTPDKDLPNRLSGKNMVNYPTLDDYFDGLALFTNTHFFSEDTISNAKYSLPDFSDLELKRESETKVYGYLNDSKLGSYRAVLYDFATSSADSEYNLTVKAAEEEAVVSDYWNILSPKAVQYSAGLIDLFFSEVAGKKSTNGGEYEQDFGGIINVNAGEKSSEGTEAAWLQSISYPMPEASLRLRISRARETEDENSVDGLMYQFYNPNNVPLRIDHLPIAFVEAQDDEKSLLPPTVRDLAVEPHEFSRTFIWLDTEWIFIPDVE